MQAFLGFPDGVPSPRSLYGHHPPTTKGVWNCLLLAVDAPAALATDPPGSADAALYVIDSAPTYSADYDQDMGRPVFNTGLVPKSFLTLLALSANDVNSLRRAKANVETDFATLLARANQLPVVAPIPACCSRNGGVARFDRHPQNNTTAPPAAGTCCMPCRC